MELNSGQYWLQHGLFSLSSLVGLGVLRNSSRPHTLIVHSQICMAIERIEDVLSGDLVVSANHLEQKATSKSQPSFSLSAVGPTWTPSTNISISI